MKNYRFAASSLRVALTLLIFGVSADVFSKPEQRIISAGGSITEILFGLNLGDSVVGVDSSSLYPKEATEKPKVGYFRNLGAEGVMSLNPSLIIAAKGAGPKPVLNQLSSLGVEVRTYDQNSYTMESWQKLVTGLGSEFDRQAEAQTMIERVVTGIHQQQEERKYAKDHLNAVALLSIGQRGPVTAGQNTVPNLLLELAGINNLAGELDGYKPFSSEVLAEQKLDLVLVPSHVVDGLGGKQAICDNQLIKLAMQGECNVHIMDGLLLLGFGTRLDLAVSEIVGLANTR
ncbi:MAG: ABC transporter substrate-binding protein [Pseudomonadota bacterium]